MKKIISFVLIALTVLSAVSCGKSTGKNTVTEKINIEGSVFGVNPGEKLPAELVFDVDWLTKGKNTKYNDKLAAFCAILSQDTYFREKDLSKGSQNRVLFEGETDEDYGFTSLLTKLGFTDTAHIETFKEKEYTVDTNDSATMNLGYMKADGKYDVFVAALRGCFSIQEWMSVFDVGADSEEYSELTGSHPEWTDKSRIKGAAVAETRAMEFLEKFISEHDDSDAENVILVTGHSRGGMIANLIGADFEKKNDFKTFTYTFNAAGVTTDADAPKCKTVFNVFDTADFYTRVLPLGNGELKLYGKNISLNIAENNGIKEKISNTFSRSYISVEADKMKDFEDTFGAAFPSRESLYFTASETQSFDSSEDAVAGLAEFTKYVGSENGLGLEEYFKFSDVREKDGKFEFDVEYSGAAILAGYAKVLAYGSAAYEVFVKLFESEPDALKAARFFNENAEGISGGHYLGNSYLLALSCD